MEAVDSAVEFLVAKSTEKKPPENLPAENKKSAGARPPPKSISQAQKSATNQQIRVSNLQVHAGFFRLGRLALGGVFRAWILGFFACLLGVVEAPMLKCTCNHSVAAGGGTRFAAYPSRQHFQSKTFVQEKRHVNVDLFQGKIEGAQTVKFKP